MEIEKTAEIGKSLENALGEWKKDYANMEALNTLGTVIKDASKNGIDLVLKMPKSVTQMGQQQRPMDLADAMEYSSDADGENVFIVIPAEANMDKYTKYKRFWLSVENYDDVPSLLFRIREHAILGVFHASEVTSIEPK